MNTSNLMILMAQTKDYQIHRKKIAQIMTKNSQILNLKRQKVLNTYYQKRDKSHQSNFKQKQNNIQRQNNFILRKIIDVNNRKSHLTYTNRALSHNHLINLKRSTFNINQQNNKFAMKLVQTQSNLSQNVLGKSYRKHLEVKDRLTKYQFDQDYGIIPKKFKSLGKIKRFDLTSSQFQGQSRLKNYDNQQQRQIK